MSSKLERHARAELATQMLHDAGFANVEVRDTPRPQNCAYISRF